MSMWGNDGACNLDEPIVPSSAERNVPIHIPPNTCSTIAPSAAAQPMKGFIELTMKRSALIGVSVTRTPSGTDSTSPSASSAGRGTPNAEACTR